MEFYRTRTKKLAGTRWSDVGKRAFALYKRIKSKSKRRAYVRSAYFQKNKIFLGLFWHHLLEKENIRDKTRRLKYFPCAIELIQNTRIHPETKEHPIDSSFIVHRFTGITPDHDIFCVQIKENKRNRQKWLLSIFPYGK